MILEQPRSFSVTRTSSLEPGTNIQSSSQVELLGTESISFISKHAEYLNGNGLLDNVSIDISIVVLNYLILMHAR